MEDKRTETLRILMRPEEKQRLRDAAKQEGVNLSDFVRRALSNYYEHLAETEQIEQEQQRGYNRIVSG